LISILGIYSHVVKIEAWKTWIVIYCIGNNIPKPLYISVTCGLKIQKLPKATRYYIETLKLEGESG
jgi:hypothetical protein